VLLCYNGNVAVTHYKITIYRISLELFLSQIDQVRFQFASWTSLFLIVLSIVGAIIFFIYAGSIAINDAEKILILKQKKYCKSMIKKTII